MESIPKTYMEQYKEFKSGGGNLSYQGFINRLNGAKPKKSYDDIYQLHKIVCGKYATKRNVITSRINNGKNIIDVVMLPKGTTGTGWKELLRKIKGEDRKRFDIIKHNITKIDDKDFIKGKIDLEDLYDKIL